MKAIRILVLFGLSLIAGWCSAQTTAVSALVTDTDGQTWNAGSYKINFVPVPGKPGPYFLNGNPFTPQSYSGALDAGGNLAVSVPPSCNITPSGSTWQFIISPNATAGSFSVNISTCGTTQNITTTLDPLAIGPRFPANFNAYGYLDIEISPIPLPGGTYYNVTNQVSRVWNGFMWTNGDGGGSCTTCVITNPTLSQFITQPPGTTFGATNFGVNCTTPSCNVVNPSLQTWAGLQVNATDGSGWLYQNTPPVYGIGLDMKGWGRSGANGEGRVSAGRQDSITMAQGGQHYGYSRDMYTFGVGDYIGENFEDWQSGGLFWPSQQGFQGFYQNGGQPNGNFVGTVQTGGSGSQSPTFDNSTIGGCQLPGLPTACLPTTLSVLMDITQGGTVGNVTASGGVMGQSIGGVAIATPGSGQTNGTYSITGTGGGPCSTEPIANIVIAGGVITTATVSNPGLGCTATPSFSVAEGGTPGTLTAKYSNLAPTIAGQNFLNVTGPLPITQKWAQKSGFAVVPAPQGASIISPGSGQTNGTYSIFGTGGGCSTEPTAQIVISAGVIASSTIIQQGVGCSSAPALIVAEGGVPGTLQWTSQTTPDAPSLVTVAGMVGYAIPAGSTMFAPGDKVCAWGSEYFETSTITNVSGSFGSQTITLPLAFANDNLILTQGGPCMQALSFDADLASPYNYRSSYQIVASLFGTDMFYLSHSLGGEGVLTIPINGAEGAVADGGAKSGYHTYCDAIITKQNSATDPPNLSLMPNTCRWTPGGSGVGDVTEGPGFPVQNVLGFWGIWNMAGPSTGLGTQGAMNLSISGMGAAGLAYGIEMSNNEPYSAYNVPGETGSLIPPGASILSLGLWQNDFYVGNNPAGDIIHLGGLRSGGPCTFGLFGADSGGVPGIQVTGCSSPGFTLDATTTVEGDFHVGGNIFASNISLQKILLGANTFPGAAQFTRDGASVAAQFQLCDLFATGLAYVGFSDAQSDCGNVHGGFQPNGRLGVGTLEVDNSALFNNASAALPPPVGIPLGVVACTGTCTDTVQYWLTSVNPSGQEGQINSSQAVFIIASGASNPLTGSNTVTLTCPTVLQGGYPGGSTYNLYGQSIATGIFRKLGTCPVGSTVVDTGGGSVVSGLPTAGANAAFSAGNYFLSGGGSFKFFRNAFSTTADTGFSSPSPHTVSFDGTTAGDGQGDIIVHSCTGCGGGSSGFPITLGSTSIAASSTTTAVTGLSVNGVSLNAAGSSSLFLNQAGGYTAPPGSGTVTTFSCVTANGVSCSVANPTTTPAATFTLGAITPTSTNGVSAATMAFMDATSSVQTQLNAKVTSIGVTTANGVSGSSSGGTTPSLTLALGAITPTSVAPTGAGFPVQTGTSSNTDLAGKLTLSGGSQTYSFTSSGITTAPICVATDTTAANAVRVTTSTTTLTLTGTGTDVINYICIGLN